MSTPYRQKAFSCDFMHPSLIPFRVPKRLAFKARVLLTFRTPLASSNLLRHFFNAQATNNNNNNNKRRSARSFETEVTEENLASRASKSRESSRPKNEDDDVKKEKQIQSPRETKDNKQTKIVVTPKYIHHRALERALLPTGRGGPLAVLWIWIFATCACACLLVAFTFLEKNGTKERACERTDEEE